MVMHQQIKQLGIMALLGTFAGCGKGPEPQTNDPAPENVVPAKAVSLPKGPGPKVSPDALYQSFDQATVDYTPSGEGPPMDKLFNGKISGKLYEAIIGHDGKPGVWEQIRLTGRDGKPLQYSVTLKTDLGDIVIELWPELAPNHVRNFLALCQVGYYDGMTFHQTLHQDFADEQGKKQV
jgi:hypothetical protein